MLDDSGEKPLTHLLGSIASALVGAPHEWNADMLRFTHVGRLVVSMRARA
ncbi:hypothetical protein X12_001469 [Xanthomonas arboricola]|nr:hypothetical protein X12_001469 [Xanthomonas arboricola]